MEHADEIRIGDWRGYGDVLFYIKGKDVVVTDLVDNFITILKDGITNARGINAKLFK